jgi:hypothetical protein
MTATGTRTAEFTITDARYVGAKIGADLRLLNVLYGRPGLDSIDTFAEEAALLLRDGYLGTVDYGFRDTATNTWKLRLRYTATTGGYVVNDTPGKLPVGAVVTGYPFYSFLTYSLKFQILPKARQDAFLDGLPVQRAGADEPITGLGTSQVGQGYGRNGSGVTRNVFTALGIEG